MNERLHHALIGVTFWPYLWRSLFASTMTSRHESSFVHCMHRPFLLLSASLAVSSFSCQTKFLNFGFVHSGFGSVLLVPSLFSGDSRSTFVKVARTFAIFQCFAKSKFGLERANRFALVCTFSDHRNSVQGYSVIFLFSSRLQQ